MAETDKTNGENSKGTPKEKNNLKYILYALFVIAIVITIANLFEWPRGESGVTYGRSLEAKIKSLNAKITKLEDRVDNLSSRNLALFILVFISLVINIIFIVNRVVSRLKTNAKE